tara:strand:+ start:95 stop:382 length:288 start_codon:yes stop_codon:yes gene_type:complete
MSKKKSYMDSKNILSEDVITSFLKGLWRGITGKKVKSSKQAQSDLKKSVDKFNSGIDKMTSAINKVRKADGKSPIKRGKKLTVNQVLDDYGKGKL